VFAVRADVMQVTLIGKRNDDEIYKASSARGKSDARRVSHSADQ
jgi:hypothetical protein